MGIIGTVLRVVVALVVVLALLIGAGLATGVLGAPSAGVADVGDWGEVTEERTEIVTTLWVDNPNPVGVSVGSGLRADYEIYMNDVRIAEGHKRGVDVESGNNTVPLRTYVDNDEIQSWWVEYVRANETIHLSAEGTATVDAGFGSADVQFPPVERTMQDESAPVAEALSGAASQAEGSYGPYEVERGYAEWGPVNRSTTTALMIYEIRNTGPVAIPAVPDGFEVDVRMNDVEMFEGGTGAMTARDLDDDATIPPGETQTVVFEVRMDNDRIDDWFRSHVRNDESTHVEADVQFVFEVEDLGTFRVPRDGVTYECDFRTAILVDGRETESDCGEGGSVGADLAGFVPKAPTRQAG